MARVVLLTRDTFLPAVAGTHIRAHRSPAGDYEGREDAAADVEDAGGGGASSPSSLRVRMRVRMQMRREGQAGGGRRAGRR